MKCEIIRDLLPSYVEGLTSAESNREIEMHLNECLECQEYLDSMQKDLEVHEKCKEKEIEPFIKIKKAAARKVVIAVIATALLCAIALELYKEHFYHGTGVMSEEVAILYEEDGNTKALKFRTYDDDVIVRVGYAENEMVDGKMPLETISLIKYNYHPALNPAGSDNEYRMHFIDENTVMCLYSYPDESDFSEDDFVAIRFEDTVKVIKMSDLRDGKIESLK